MTTVKLEDLIIKRRSIRSYLDKKIPKEIIKRILHLANLAPTASGKENRRFIVVEDEKIKGKLYKASLKQSHLLEAPVIVAVVTDSKMFKAKEFLSKNKTWGIALWGANVKNYKENKRFLINWKIWRNFWALQDADAATTTLLLAAKAKGLDTCWIGLYDHDLVNKILKIPRNYEVTALITLGYQKNPPYPQKRKRIEELLHWNQW